MEPVSQAVNARVREEPQVEIVLPGKFTQKSLWIFVNFIAFSDQRCIELSSVYKDTYYDDFSKKWMFRNTQVWRLLYLPCLRVWRHHQPELHLHQKPRISQRILGHGLRLIHHPEVFLRRLLVEVRLRELPNPRTIVDVRTVWRFMPWHIRHDGTLAFSLLDFLSFYRRYFKIVSIGWCVCMTRLALFYYTDKHNSFNTPTYHLRNKCWTAWWGKNHNLKENKSNSWFYQTSYAL